MGDETNTKIEQESIWLWAMVYYTVQCSTLLSYKIQTFKTFKKARIFLLEKS